MPAPPLLPAQQCSPLAAAVPERVLQNDMLGLECVRELVEAYIYGSVPTVR